ncbi:MAG: hypothetical protein JNL42_10970 [Anaerolineae bacterium]|nr:hypothetical protein [Anaerolineae bacterium]
MIQLDGQTILISLALCCAIPFVLLVALSYRAVRGASRLLQPEAADLRADWEKFRAQHPAATPDQLVETIIRRQALRSGIIGALTSVGGLPVLPLGLTIDLVTSARLQAETVYFIGRAYHGDQPGEPSDLLNLNEVLTLGSVLKVSGRDLLVMGGQRLSRYVLRRTMLVVAEKAAAKLVPFIGLAIGFAVNYLTTQGVARVAKGWYTGKIVEPGLMRQVRGTLQNFQAPKAAP